MEMALVLTSNPGGKGGVGGKIFNWGASEEDIGGSSVDPVERGTVKGIVK